MAADKQLGRYLLLDRLGQGGMATVYRAHDPQLGRDVAVKVMHPFIAERHPAEAARRFEREARAVAGLRHPNVLLLHDYHPAEGEQAAYLVMELLGGPSLRSFLDQHGTPFAEVGAIIGLRVAQALEAAHANDIIHRDVKPENVMFDGTRVVLCDFGIARLAVEGHTMTATGAVIGSPVFMSPEQARGDNTDARSDLFSLGSLLYVLATGVPPFVATQPLAIMNKIAKGEHPPPMSKNPRVPRWLERIIERCLKVDPAERFPSATAVIAALTEGLRADGLGDFDGELATYLRDPPAYNEHFGERMVAASLAQMREAVTHKQRARALTAASRVLAWEPQHQEAMGVVDKFDARPRRWLWVALPLALALVGGGGWVAMHRAPVVVDKPIAEKPLADTPIAEKPIAEKPTAEKPIAEKPIADKPTADKPIADKPTADKPTFEKPTAERPIAEKVKRKHLVAEVAPSPKAEVPVVQTPPPPPVVEPEKPATLTVAIKPWCDLTVDGKPRGRAPKSLELPAGLHQVECRHSSGASIRREVTLLPGGTELLREQLFAPARITPELAGAAFSVDDTAPSPEARPAAPGRHKIAVYRQGKIAETGFVDVRPEGCRLVANPEPACERP
jgi:hypothetical protein